jgi:general stress protein YciG
MTLAEAGRRGGEKVKRERGPDFYATIGRKGGRRVAESHGASFYAEIGRKGGEARRLDPLDPRRSPEHARNASPNAPDSDVPGDEDAR